MFARRTGRSCARSCVALAIVIFMIYLVDDGFGPGIASFEAVKLLFRHRHCSHSMAFKYSCCAEGVVPTGTKVGRVGHNHSQEKITLSPLFSLTLSPSSNVLP